MADRKPRKLFFSHVSANSRKSDLFLRQMKNEKNEYFKMDKISVYYI